MAATGDLLARLYFKRLLWLLGEAMDTKGEGQRAQCGGREVAIRSGRWQQTWREVHHRLPLRIGCGVERQAGLTRDPRLPAYEEGEAMSWTGRTKWRETGRLWTSLDMLSEMSAGWEGMPGKL